MTETSEHRLISFDETPLFYRRVRPAEPKASLFLLHGMGEHGGRYLSLASFLAERGIETWLPDFRGFGKSGGRRGHLRHFDDLKKDVSALTALAAREGEPAAQFYLGHSFGGLLVSRMAALYPCVYSKGIILTSPLFGITIPVPAWQKMLGFAASKLFPSFTQNNRVRADLLTHDKAMCQSHNADRLIHFLISARLYTEMLRAISESQGLASRIHCPALILQAGDDKIVSREKTELFYKRLGSSDKELEIYEGWYHEILNETERTLVFERISDWVLKHT